MIGIYFWCTNQFVIQRALGAKSLDHARWGALFAGLLKLPNLFILVLPGVMATALYSDLGNPDMVFPALAFDLLPVGLRGLMLAAVAAAILSSLEAIFNSASTLFTMDFVRTLRPQTSDQALSRTGRTSTLVLVVIAALWTPQIQRFPTLWQYLQSILSYLTPPIVAVFVIGIFWRGATSTAAFATLAGGVSAGLLAWIAVEILEFVSIQYLYACGLLFLIHCSAMIMISRLTPTRASEAARENTWSMDLWRRDSRALAGRPWYADYRRLALLLILLIAGVVVWWW